MMAAGEHHSLALTHDRKRLYAFGRGDYGQLGIGYQETGANITTPTPVLFPEETLLSYIDCGERHSMAISSNQELYTWGFNETGATGHEVKDDSDYFRPRKLDLAQHVVGDIVHVHAASGGGQHSLMLIKRYRSA